ncbi:TetR/AcrR family transcriptional regulator [Cryptosporangium phraense]|uniref:Helix-turn-helix transcriptional regulator n=1 Tax=Cryptosporangium phraense TaxID=2593070 RepID=A0A545AL26_9ACTN|nr:helix-turn-helix domain-containing protein [Cryptosporangium phraense]TQS42018.1 helix-turn-helix transcriptional regulator [Cryptosporangium phraense]
METTRATATREAILDAAERLFAERGLTVVSNRQVSEAAGQGNNAAVNYHFGTKTDLVRAILRRHHGPVIERRRALVESIRGSEDPRDWISCWVRPATDYLESLGAPTWFARFSAQLMADPAYRDLVTSEALEDPILTDVLDGLNRCSPPLPLEVRLQRNYMTRLLIVDLLAECERVLAEGGHGPWVGWSSAASGLTDALVGLWLAPVSPLP